MCVLGLIPRGKDVLIRFVRSSLRYTEGPASTPETLNFPAVLSGKKRQSPPLHWVQFGKLDGPTSEGRGVGIDI